MLDATTLRVGDRVAFGNYRFGAAGIHFAKVARLTKTTIVLDNGRRFNLRGAELKSDRESYPRTDLLAAADADARVLADKKRRSRNMLIAELKKALDGCRACGDYHITDEAAGFALQLIAALAAK